MPSIATSYVDRNVEHNPMYVDTKTHAKVRIRLSSKPQRFSEEGRVTSRADASGEVLSFRWLVPTQDQRKRFVSANEACGRYCDQHLDFNAQSLLSEASVGQRTLST